MMMMMMMMGILLVLLVYAVNALPMQQQHHASTWPARWSTLSPHPAHPPLHGTLADRVVDDEQEHSPPTPPPTLTSTGEPATDASGIQPLFLNHPAMLHHHHHHLASMMTVINPSMYGSTPWVTSSHPPLVATHTAATFTSNHPVVFMPRDIALSNLPNPPTKSLTIDSFKDLHDYWALDEHDDVPPLDGTGDPLIPELKSFPTSPFIHANIHHSPPSPIHPISFHALQDVSTAKPIASLHLPAMARAKFTDTEIRQSVLQKHADVAEIVSSQQEQLDNLPRFNTVSHFTPIHHPNAARVQAGSSILTEPVGPGIVPAPSLAKPGVAQQEEVRARSVGATELREVKGDAPSPLTHLLASSAVSADESSKLKDDIIQLMADFEQNQDSLLIHLASNEVRSIVDDNITITQPMIWSDIARLLNPFFIHADAEGVRQAIPQTEKTAYLRYLKLYQAGSIPLTHVRRPFLWTPVDDSTICGLLESICAMTPAQFWSDPPGDGTVQYYERGAPIWAQENAWKCLQISTGRGRFEIQFRQRSLVRTDAFCAVLK